MKRGLKEEILIFDYKIVPYGKDHIVGHKIWKNLPILFGRKFLWLS